MKSTIVCLILRVRFHRSSIKLWKRVEYILIGTLLSFSIAIITGIFTLLIIKNR
jgi:hypothetical protein